MDWAERDHRAADFADSDFEGFYRRTAGGLWRYLRRLSDSAMADELLQESYIRALCHPGRSLDERERKAYLYRIATNLVRDRWRRRRREESLIERMTNREPLPEKRNGALDLIIDVGAILDTLKPQERALLWLAYVEQYEHREIADILGVKAASVRVLLFRARGKFSQALQEHGL